MRGLSGTGFGRVGLITFGFIALLAIGALALAARGMLTGADAQPAKRAIQPAGTEEAAPEPVGETADKTEPESKSDQIERAVKEPSPVGNEASASAPADTLMSLSIPAIGISEIPVVEGTSEASLSQGVGHVPGTGYPWVPGSNTYIAGHRIGYPGTQSGPGGQDLTHRLERYNLHLRCKRDLRGVAYRSIRDCANRRRRSLFADVHRRLW
jgi:hypothetical protein